MNSCIYIDGIVLWVIIAILLILAATALFSSIAYAVIQNENEILRNENKKLKENNEDLRDDLSRLQQKVYSGKFRENLSTLEVDDNGGM